MKMLSYSLAAMLLGSAAVMAAPAIAKDAKEPKVEAPKPPKLSKPYATGLSAAQKLLAAGDAAGANAALTVLEATPPTAEDDAYTLMALRLNAAIGLKDNVLIEQTLTKMLATGKVPAADQPKFYKFVGQLAMQRKDYNSATVAFEKLAKISPNDPDDTVGLAELYYAQKQNAKAVDTIGAAIAMKKAANQPVEEAWYRRRLAIAYDGKLQGVVQPAALDLISAYPNAVNWRDVIIITREIYPSVDEQTELDFLRLQSATGSLNGERDYVEYADTALGRGLPGEAKSAIDEGIAKKMLSPSKSLVSELQRTANAKAATDKATLPGLEKDARTSPKLALGTADAYFGYGEYAKAASLYQLAKGGAGVDPATVNLRLGMALAKSGDKVGAAKALREVKGGARESLAKYWLAYIGA